MLTFFFPSEAFGVAFPLPSPWEERKGRWGRRIQEYFVTQNTKNKKTYFKKKKKTQVDEQHKHTDLAWNSYVHPLEISRKF